MKRTNNFLLTLIFSFVIICANAAGEVDTTFNTYAAIDTGVNVDVVKTQPDGKILIGGFFTVVDGKPSYGLSRLNVDGTQDTTFNPPEFVSGFGIGGRIFAIGFQSDGKIIVGGQFNGIGNENFPGLRRLNVDGSLDTSFNVFQMLQDHSIVDIEVLANDKMVVAGSIRTPGSGSVSGFLQLNSDGTLDTSFTADQFVAASSGVEIQPDGKILVAATNGQNGVRRYNSNGSIDNSFTPAEVTQITDIKYLANGSVLICGVFNSVNGFTQRGLSKINSDGSIDLSFNQGNAGVLGSFEDIIERPDGKFVLSGIFTSYNGVARRNIVQLNADASIDNSFLFVNNFNGFNDNFKEAHLLSNGQIIVATISPNNAPVLFKLNTDGTRDMSFVPKVTRIGTVQKIIQQADGKIVYGGRFDIANNLLRNALTRVNADGTNDTTFVPYFNSTAKQTVTAIASQSDGKLLVGTIGGGIQLKRLNIDGSEDVSFNSSLSSNTSVFDILVLTNGKILISTSLSSNVWQIKRLNSDGSDDLSFVASAPNGAINKMLAQTDGKILIGGNFTQLGATIRGRIARLNVDGSIDNTFNPPGGANGDVTDLDIQSDGKVVLVGSFTGLNGNLTKKTVGRLNADGSLDSTFSQTTNATVFGVKIQIDGKILIAGSMSLVGSTTKNGIARLNTDGTLDTGFTAESINRVFDINLQTDGKVLVCGEFLKINGISAVRVARLNNNQTAVTQAKQYDFDGDGKADIAVYRPSNNNWYRLNSSNGSFVQLNFGIAADQIAPADFDNDGKFDLSIFRPGTGTWWYRDVANGNFLATQWGASGDLSIPSDVDGDGKADRVVFRPSNGGWYRLKSATGQFDSTQFGVNGDVPVIVDFDGDGKSDIAVFRPSSGTWYWLESSTGQFRGTQFGQNGDLAVPADYDGDGKTELAVFRQSTGDWFFIDSSTGLFRHYNFGVTGDKPVAADYDGDGKADIAVYRPSLGTWYLQRSQLGFTSIQFGIAEDIPVPNAFVR